MSLRKKTLIAFGLTFAGLMAALYAVPRSILLHDFAQIEVENVRKNLRRVVEAINNDLTGLQGSASDYGGWDDTYNYVVDHNKTFIETNFTGTTYTNLRANLALILDLSGQTVFAQAFDLEKVEEIPIPPTLSTWLAEKQKTRSKQEDPVWSGVAVIPEGPVLLASSPILTSERKGPSRGSMIFGRFLDAAEIKRLGYGPRFYAGKCHAIEGLKDGETYYQEQFPGGYDSWQAALEAIQNS